MCIDWLLTHLRESAWSSEQLFKCRGCFSCFQWELEDFIFFFAEINVSTFVFVVFKEIGEVFRRLRRVTAAHVLIKCAFVDSFSDFCALVY